MNNRKKRPPMVELKKLPKGILSGLYQKKTGSMLSVSFRRYVVVGESISGSSSAVSE
jgi:hypothetical protein